SDPGGPGASRKPRETRETSPRDHERTVSAAQRCGEWSRALLPARTRTAAPGLRTVRCAAIRPSGRRCESPTPLCPGVPRHKCGFRKVCCLPRLRRQPRTAWPAGIEETPSATSRHNQRREYGGIFLFIEWRPFGREGFCRLRVCFAAHLHLCPSPKAAY